MRIELTVNVGIVPTRVYMHLKPIYYVPVLPHKNAHINLMVRMTVSVDPDNIYI